MTDQNKIIVLDRDGVINRAAVTSYPSLAGMRTGNEFTAEGVLRHAAEASHP